MSSALSFSDGRGLWEERKEIESESERIRFSILDDFYDSFLLLDIAAG